MLSHVSPLGGATGRQWWKEEEELADSCLLGLPNNDLSCLQRPLQTPLYQRP
jgi:hypothetical protein